MIVDQYYRGGIFGDRFAKYFAGMDERRVEQTSRYCNVTLETVLRIENRNVKLFDRKILKAGTENLVYIAGTANGDSVLAIFCRHATAKLERRVNRDRTRVADAGERCERGNRLR